MSLEDGVAGIALYFELNSADVDGFHAQYIVLPSVVLPSGEVMKHHVRSRALSAKRKQPQWRKHWDDSGKSALHPHEQAMKGYAQESNMELALDRGLEQLRATIATIQPVVYANYKLVGEPLLVEFSEQDAMEMHADTTPRGLISRINRLREAKEFPVLPGKED